jgi:hypothetical protein
MYIFLKYMIILIIPKTLLLWKVKQTSNLWANWGGRGEVPAFGMWSHLKDHYVWEPVFPWPMSMPAKKARNWKLKHLQYKQHKHETYWPTRWDQVVWRGLRHKSCLKWKVTVWLQQIITTWKSRPRVSRLSDFFVEEFLWKISWF